MDTVRLLPVLTLLTAGLLGMTFASDVSNSRQPQRDQAVQLMRAGNYKDAYEVFRKLALDPQDDPRKVGEDLQMATQCLANLGRIAEIDAFREAVIPIHKANWRLLWAAAENTMQIQHQGFRIAGQFQRGPHRGGGEVVNSVDRDRVRALQLMHAAIPLAIKDADHPAVGQFFLNLAGILLNQRGASESWRLQSLTDLGTLPDYESGWWYYRGEVQGAPVDEAGRPVYYQVPKSWEAAKSDGQRWRWCLVQAAEFDPGRLQEIRLQFANFLHNQFGVQTMAFFGWRFGRTESDDTQEASGIFAVNSLKETETIARLATGIRRFDMPEEFNFIRIYQQVAEEAKDHRRVEALAQLAQIFENRRQYPRAAEYWMKAVEAATGDPERQNFRDRLEQIVANWGRFEPILTQPAVPGATVEYRFRNGREVEFVAQPIKVEKLLEDVKAYIKTRPPQLDWQKTNIADLGYRLVYENQTQYVGNAVATWKLALEPRENHLDKRVTVATPLQKPGAYLVTAKMAGGNTSLIILWLADTAIAKKPLDGKTWYFVADAVSGKPVAKANVEFFGWRQQWRAPNRMEIDTRNFAEFTNADGQVIPDPARQPQDHQWLVTARTPEGRFAYLGFSNVWYGRYYDADYNQVKVFTITDRPVYRPGQPVDYKFWVRRAQYDHDGSDFAEQPFTVEIHNPKGEKIVETSLTTDAYAGMEGKYLLPADAMLGAYAFVVRQGNRHYGRGSFRVEEYKKPEYEVIVESPKDPVMLGEKIAATIRAKYYFGSPVTKAKVKYKIQRTEVAETWYPPSPWDWLYEPGYWWFAYDCAWYPGWREWGWHRPLPFWFPRSTQPPELVADREVEIGADGTVKVEIDTALAKALHPDRDHRYTITAEVIDQSRRTIVGTGTALVARKPFTVTAWVDRGYYRVGDVIHTHFAARTLDGKPVQGTGKLTVYQVSYEQGARSKEQGAGSKERGAGDQIPREPEKPVEREIYSIDLPTNEEGLAMKQFQAAKAGQFRLAYKLTDAKGHTIEGGYLFTIIGTGFTGDGFKFNHVELIPDRKDYRPGEAVKMQINTDRLGSTVLLFVRPTNGIYLPPTMLRMEGKSMVQEIGVVQKDMPNFLVEGAHRGQRACVQRGEGDRGAAGETDSER